MSPFATAAIILEAIFWIALLSVAGVFLAALIKGNRGHQRSQADFGREAGSRQPPVASGATATITPIA